MGAVDLGQPRRTVEAPPQPALFVNDVGLSVVTGGMLEMRLRYHGESAGVGTVVTQPVVVPMGVILETIVKNLDTILMAAASQSAQDQSRLVRELIERGLVKPQPNGAGPGVPTPEDLARARRDAAGD